MCVGLNEKSVVFKKQYRQLPVSLAFWMIAQITRARPLILWLRGRFHKDPVPTGPRIDLPIRENGDQDPERRSKGDQRETGSSGNARAIRI